jgi:yeast amino acid transporter
MTDADLSFKDDIEKHAEKHRRGSLEDFNDENLRRGSVTAYHEGFFSAFTLDSFKRNRNARMVTEATDAEGHPLPDQPPAEPALAMKLKERHLQMIAIGGSIGKWECAVLVQQP